MAQAIVLMGVSGSGKTTVGKALANKLGWTFFEGDNYMPAENVEKMAAGISLTDEDRAPWLSTLQEFLADQASQDFSTVLACSALKESYRRQLEVEGLSVRFVYLKGDYDLIVGRMRERAEHYMPESLLQSQFDTLEEPQDAIEANVAQPVDQIVEQIVNALPYY